MAGQSDTSIYPPMDVCPFNPAALEHYHPYEKLGERFVYHLGSGRFFRIDEPAYRLLELCRTMPLESAKACLASTRTGGGKQM